MNRSRKIIKKFIYKVLGEKTYQRAYVRGKTQDIKAGINRESAADYLKHFISAQSTVLDIGANYGHYTVEMSELCSKGSVLAFEPVLFTFEVLQKVKDNFQLQNVELYHAAVSDRKGSIEMTVPLLEFGAPNTGVAYVGKNENSNSQSINVETICLDDLDISGKIDFIKIDIEGHEPNAFKGMENLIGKNRPVILIEFSYSCLQRAGTVPKDFADYISNKLDYCFASINENNLKLVSENVPGDGYYFLIPREKISNFSSIFKS